MTVRKEIEVFVSGTRKLLAAFVVATVAVMLLGLLAKPAVAQALWPVDVSDVQGHHLLSHSDGSVSAAECNNYSQQYPKLQTFAADGQPTSTLNHDTWDDLRFCGTHIYGWGMAGAVSAAGVVFGTAFSYTDGTVHVAAYHEQDNERELLWNLAMFDPCTLQDPAPTPLTPQWFDVGADGFLYVLYGETCGLAASLAKINATNGSVVYHNTLGDVQAVEHVAMTNIGVVVIESYWDVVQNNNILYYSYTGDLVASISMAPTVNVDSYGVTADGRVYIADNDEVPECGSDYTRRMLGYWLTGMILRHSVSDAGCPQVSQVVGTSNGLVVYEAVLDSDEARVVTVGPDGQTIAQAAQPATTPQQDWYDSASDWRNRASLTADTNGNVLYTRAIYPGDPQEEWYHEHHFLLEAETLAVLDELRTDSISAGTTQAWQIGAAMATNTLYVAMDDQCPASTCTRMLHAIEFEGMGLDYPRGEVLTGEPISPEINLVAKGDSFSSGYGVPPFEAGTDIPGVNECYRSEGAYAMLLDQDSSLNITLTDFVACSGAQTEHLFETPHWGEDPQVEALTTDTRLVTLTIGGNDVDFEAFAEACKDWGDSCSEGTGAYNSVMYIIEEVLPDRLNSLFGAMSAKLNEVGAHALVLTVGYPFVIREHLGGGLCAVAGITQADQQAAEAVTIALNEELAAAVLRMNAVDSRFRYVDASLSTSPFEGNDLCSLGTLVDPYFNTTDAHPTAKGHEAYKLLIKDYLLAIR